MTIVYQRDIDDSDFTDIAKKNLIIYKNNNIAFLVSFKNEYYFVREQKIFNRQIINEYTYRTKKQVIKKINY